MYPQLAGTPLGFSRSGLRTGMLGQRVQLPVCNSALGALIAQVVDKHGQQNDGTLDHILPEGVHVQ